MGPTNTSNTHCLALGSNSGGWLLPIGERERVSRRQTGHILTRINYSRIEIGNVALRDEWVGRPSSFSVLKRGNQEEETKWRMIHISSLMVE
jgi:hypothetical protein